MNIYPAILSDDPEVVKDQLASIANISAAEVVQIDIIDGFFADNVTLTPADLGQFDFGDKQIDLHLMVSEPVDVAYEAIDYRDELPIRAIIGQVEQMSSQAHFLEEVAKQHWIPGLCLNLFTPLSVIDKDSWDFFGVLQLMGIDQVGFQNQGFAFSVLEKIKEASEYIKSHDHLVELIVDGGVKLENIPAIKAAGADSISVGSGLWQADITVDRFAEYQEKMKERHS